MRPIALTLLLLLAACGRSTPDAAPAAIAAPASLQTAAAHLPPAVADYLAALLVVEQAKAPVTLEALFAKAEAAQDALMEITSGVDGKALLETYDEAGFAALQARVRGLVIHRGMDIYAQPEPGFFLALARTRGLPADVAFFEQYAATWGPDLIPVYLKLRPQPTPCVRFGESRIAPMYAAWQAFAARHPNAYAQHAAQNLRDLEEAVALGTCACDGAQTVKREQDAFLKQFPASPKAAEIRARREQLDKDPDVLPVNCR